MYKVLIVEDDMAIRFIYRNLKEWDKNGFYIAAEAENGKRALELLKTEKFDMMLLDVVLPEMDGLELLEVLEKNELYIPTVIASTYNEFEYARKGMQHGALDYLVKPVSREDLDKCLGKLRKKLDKEENEYRIRKLLTACGLDMEHSFAQKIEKYMENDIDFSMGSMAEYFGLSKDYFGKVFHQENGCTFQQFAMKYKMEQAKSLLLDTDMKIYEISESLGYKTTDYFTKLFRDYTGISPQRYRKTLNKITDL